MSSYGADDRGERNVLLELELDPQVDLNEADLLARQLFLEIRELDLEAVDPQLSRDPPEGAKGTPSDWSTLLITFSAAGGVFTTLITLARDWLLRHSSDHRIKLTIDEDSIVLDRASAHEREELINAWMRRHSSR